jgi:5,10-methylenetetrahydrofolate reductase
MIEEARRFSSDTARTKNPLRIGVTSKLAPLLPWKREADFLFVQVSFSLEALLRWRWTIDFDGPVFAGVMAPPSATMARKLSSEIPELAVPDPLVQALDRDSRAGVDFACQMVSDIRDSGAFDGVHLIPIARYREIAARLEPS